MTPSGKTMIKKKTPTTTPTTATATTPTTATDTGSTGKTTSKSKDTWFLDQPIEDYSWTDKGIYVTPTGEKMLLPNNKQFGAWINKKYGKYKLTDVAKDTCEPKKSTQSG